MGRFIFILLFCVSLTAQAQSTAIGFQRGNELQAIYFIGRFDLDCSRAGRARQRVRLIRCSQEEISPGAFDAFRYPSAPDANEVRLVTSRENGKIYQQTERFDARRGLSRPFNLWARTLTQRPLLDYGTQTVQYMLLRNGESVVSGSFEATVAQLPGRSCPYVRYFSNDPWVCNQARDEELCSLYFEREKQCQ